MNKIKYLLLATAVIGGFAGGMAVAGRTLVAQDATQDAPKDAVAAENEFMPANPSDTAFPAPVVENKEAIEQLIHDYIMDNPEVIIQAVEKYGEAQRAVEQERTQGAVKDNVSWLYQNKAHPEAGNKDGDITIVEFFDYNCGYCKRALSDIMTIMGEDSNIRVVFVELPILGPTSTDASKWALAAAKQDLYLEFHVALMEHRGRINDEQLAVLAEKVGLDVEKLKADKNSAEIAAQIDENIEMARTLGITGTPAFTIGEDLARGYVGLDALRAGIKSNRDAAKK